MKRIITLTAAALLMAMSAPAFAAEKVSLMLDWYPNPNHVALYVAQAEGYFAEEGLDVDIVVPADPHAPLKLVAAGRFDFAVSYQPEVLLAQQERLPVVSVGALMQHPLSSVAYLKKSGITRPADFKGKHIAYSVEPLYRVLFETVAAHDGLTVDDYETVSAGFNLVPPLLTGKVAGSCGIFRNYEVIQMELEGQDVGVFAFEDYGVPDFYELVLIANRAKADADPDRIAAFLRAVEKGVEKTLAEPDYAFEKFMELHPDIDRKLNSKAFAATLPFMKGSPAQEKNRWEALKTFLLEKGVLEKAYPVDEVFWEVR